jgi:hypothetical protein
MGHFLRQQDNVVQAQNGRRADVRVSMTARFDMASRLPPFPGLILKSAAMTPLRWPSSIFNICLK